MKRKIEHDDVAHMAKKQAALLRRTVNPLKSYTYVDKRFFLEAKEQLTLAKFSSVDLVHPVGNNWLSCRTSKLKESLPLIPFPFELAKKVYYILCNNTVLYLSNH